MDMCRAILSSIFSLSMGLRGTPLLEMDLFLSIFQIEDVGFVNLVFEKFCCNEFPKPYSKLGQLDFDVHGTLSC